MITRTYCRRLCLKNMDALIDTNVLMNFISGRDDPYREASNQLMVACAEGRFRGYIAFHALSTIWYVVRKQKSEMEARFWLEQLCNFTVVVGVPQQGIVEAIRNRQFKDFEDCLQDECAYHANADYLITCNGKDYRYAKSKVVTPDEFISILNGESEGE